MKTSQVLLYVGGAFLLYELVLKPKTPTVVYPAGYVAPATNPISTLLNLITGKPTSSAATTQALAQAAAATAAYSTANPAPYTAAQAATATYQDSAGNTYDANGTLIAVAPSGYTPDPTEDLSSSGTSDLSDGSLPDPTLTDYSLD